MAQHWMALVLLGLYTLILMYNAFLGLRASASVEGYYVGGRNMSGPVIGLSFFATFASTNSYIGHAGKGYEYGLAWMAMPVMLIFFTFVSWRFIGPKTRLLARNFDALTLPDFLAARFLSANAGPRAPLRIATAVIVMLCSLLYLIAIFKGAGHLFERFFQIPYDLSIGLALAIVVLYTSVGGFVSVVRTDALQGLMMVFGAVLIFYFVTRAAGGVDAITALAAIPDSKFVFDLNGGGNDGNEKKITRPQRKDGRIIHQGRHDQVCIRDPIKQQVGIHTNGVKAELHHRQTGDRHPHPGSKGFFITKPKKS